MICFYPGPSQLSPGISDWLAEAYSSGILTRNHRSEPFMKLYEQTRQTLQQKLLVPDGYELVFTSSATECWEIITQAFQQVPQYHFFNGAFGEKWYDYSILLNSEHYRHPFPQEQIVVPKHLSEDPCILCLTQCETSNGTATPVSPEWRNLNPLALVAVDATASLGGIHEDIRYADIWFASVQKCFGLPSGLAVMLISPEAQKRAGDFNERNHYNSLSRILENSGKNQTSYTPNILGIFLLQRVLSSRPAITEIDHTLRQRMDQLDHIVNAHTVLDYLIQNKAARSPTVAAIRAQPDHVDKIKSEALDAGFILGNGYGSYKQDTIRIANFPAIRQDQWDAMLEFLGNINY